MLCIRDDALLASQQQQQRRVGIASLNQRLYSCTVSHSGAAGICSPTTSPSAGCLNSRRGALPASHNLSAFRQTFDRTDVRYVLLRNARRRNRSPHVPRTA